MGNNYLYIKNRRHLQLLVHFFPTCVKFVSYKQLSGRFLSFFLILILLLCALALPQKQELVNLISTQNLLEQMIDKMNHYSEKIQIQKMWNQLEIAVFTSHVYKIGDRGFP